MPRLRRRRLYRCLHECNSTPARAAERTAQGSHRAMGARVSAFCPSRPADRLPAGDAAVVGLLAQGHRYWRDGRAHVARVDDGQRQACLPSRNVAEASWPPSGITPQRLLLTDAGLRNEAAPLTARAVCSPQTVGKCSGSWVPFGRGHDQAEDQRDDDIRSLVFETPPLDTPIEILGAAIVTLDLASDKPMANLVVRLCDVHPSGESLRVSYGVLNLAHRDGHDKPAPLAVGQRYRVRIQLNDAGSVFPAGHRIRLALSTAY